jgi:phage-related protein
MPKLKPIFPRNTHNKITVDLEQGLIVKKLSLEIIQLERFKKEIRDFPIETREDIFSLIERFIYGEVLSQKDLKIFRLEKNIKILEFRVKDQKGNWRAISTIKKGKYLLMVYAFHKKTQELQEKDKETIRLRIRNFNL